MLTSESRARDFPHLDGQSYLNTAAEGVPPVSVGEALAQYVEDKQTGMDGRIPHFEQWDKARQQVGQAFGMAADEVSICSCSSEAFNLAAQAARLQAGDEVIINDLDFPAGSTPWMTDGCAAATRVWHSRDWSLHLEDLAELITSRTIPSTTT